MQALIGLFLIGIAAAGWLFLVQPEWVLMRSLRQDVAGVRALRDEIEGLIAKRDELYQEYQAIPPKDVARLMAVAPEDPKTLGMIVTLESLANQSGVTLKQVEFSSPGGGGMGADAGAFRTIPVSLSIDGTYDGFLLFLKNIERNARLIDVTDFAFSELNPSQRMGFSIRGKMFYRR